MTPGEMLDFLLDGKQIIDMYGYKRWWFGDRMHCERNGVTTKLDMPLALFVEQVRDGRYTIYEDTEEFEW